MGWDIAIRQLVRSATHISLEPRLDLADPAASHPQPGPRPLGASCERLLARLGLSGSMESLPAAGTRKQCDLKRAGRRKRRHVDIVGSRAVRFIFCKESLTCGNDICLDRSEEH